MIHTTNKQRVPALRFKGYDDLWESNRLNSVAVFLKGKGISKADLVDDGQFECIRYGELYTTYNEIIQEVKSKTNIPSKELVFSKYNDVIIPASGESNIDIATASCVLKEGVALSGDLNIIRTKNDGVFLSFYLNSKRKIDIARLAQGVSVVHLYSSQLKTLKLNLPTLPEQQKIASFLSGVDEKIQQLTKKKELLKQYKKGVMQQLFSGQLRFKDKDGNNYPEWEEKRLGGVCDVNPKNSDLPDEFIYIDLESVVKGELVKEDFIHKNDAPSRAQRNLKPDDILYQTVRPYQKNNLFFSKEGDYVASTGYAQLRTQESAMFIYQLIHSDKFVNNVLERCTGTSYPAINSSDLAKINIQLPCLEEQQKIATYLSSIDTKLERVSGQIEKTQVFKKGLLQQMFV